MLISFGYGVSASEGEKMKKGREEAERGKVIAYLRSQLFPWNFVIEDVEEESIEHFVPYAIRMCEAKGIKKGTVEEGEEKAVISNELRDAMNYYLSEAGDREVVKTHGEFAADYPFAFAQSLVYTVLYQLGLTLDEVVNLNALSEFLELNIEGIKRRERFVHDLISRNETEPVRTFSKSILNRNVITSGGDYMGSVGDIVFDTNTGRVVGLMVYRDSERRKISIDDLVLDIYSQNIVLKNTELK